MIIYILKLPWYFLSWCTGQEGCCHARVPAGQAGGGGDQAQGDQEQGVHCEIVFPVVLCYYNPVQSSQC